MLFPVAKGQFVFSPPSFGLNVPPAVFAPEMLNIRLPLGEHNGDPGAASGGPTLSTLPQEDPTTASEDDAKISALGKELRRRFQIRILPHILRKVHPRVLLVISDEATRLSMLLRLTKMNFVVDECADGDAAAVRYRHPGYYDVCLIDDEVGLASGVSVALQVRHIEVQDQFSAGAKQRSKSRVARQHHHASPSSVLPVTTVASSMAKTDLSSSVVLMTSSPSSTELLLASVVAPSTPLSSSSSQAAWASTYTVIVGLAHTLESRRVMIGSTVPNTDGRVPLFDLVLRHPFAMHEEFFLSTFVSKEVLERLSGPPTLTETLKILAGLNQFRTVTLTELATPEALRQIALDKGVDPLSVGILTGNQAPLPSAAVLHARLRTVENDWRAATDAMTEAQRETDAANVSAQTLRLRLQQSMDAQAAAEQETHALTSKLDAYKREYQALKADMVAMETVVAASKKAGELALDEATKLHAKTMAIIEGRFVAPGGGGKRRGGSPPTSRPPTGSGSAQQPLEAANRRSPKRGVSQAQTASLLAQAEAELARTPSASTVAAQVLHAEVVDRIATLAADNRRLRDLVFTLQSELYASQAELLALPKHRTLTGRQRGSSQTGGQSAVAAAPSGGSMTSPSSIRFQEKPSVVVLNGPATGARTPSRPTAARNNNNPAAVLRGGGILKPASSVTPSTTSQLIATGGEGGGEDRPDVASGLTEVTSSSFSADEPRAPTAVPSSCGEAAGTQDIAQPSVDARAENVTPPLTADGPRLTTLAPRSGVEAIATVDDSDVAGASAALFASTTSPASVGTSDESTASFGSLAISTSASVKSTLSVARRASRKRMEDLLESAGAAQMNAVALEQMVQRQQGTIQRLGAVAHAYRRRLCAAERQSMSLMDELSGRLVVQNRALHFANPSSDGYKWLASLFDQHKSAASALVRETATAKTSTNDTSGIAANAGSGAAPTPPEGGGHSSTASAVSRDAVTTLSDTLRQAVADVDYRSSHGSLDSGVRITSFKDLPPPKVAETSAVPVALPPRSSTSPSVAASFKPPVALAASSARPSGSPGARRRQGSPKRSASQPAAPSPAPLNPLGTADPTGVASGGGTPRARRHGRRRRPRRQRRASERSRTGSDDVRGHPGGDAKQRHERALGHGVGGATQGSGVLQRVGRSRRERCKRCGRCTGAGAAVGPDRSAVIFVYDFIVASKRLLRVVESERRRHDVHVASMRRADQRRPSRHARAIQSGGRRHTGHGHVAHGRTVHAIRVFVCGVDDAGRGRLFCAPRRGRGVHRASVPLADPTAPPTRRLPHHLRRALCDGASDRGRRRASEHSTGARCTEATA